MYLSIQEKQIKRIYADFDLDIICLDILAFTGHEMLEWQDLLVHRIPSDGLTDRKSVV